MRFIDILSLVLSVLGTYSVVLYVRFLFPRNAIPFVSTMLDETEILLDRAEAVEAIPNASEYRRNFAILGSQFTRMRTESHRSPGVFQQLRLAFQSLLTYRLYSLSSQIGVIRRQVEMALDEHQLQLALVTVQIATTMAVPAPAAAMAIPAVNVAEITSPPPAAEP